MVYMPDLKEKKSAAAKEPVEISCGDCDTRFRLWVPADNIAEWEKGVRISCVRCGSQFFVRKGRDGFEISSLKPSAQERQAEPREVQHAAAQHQAPHAAHQEQRAPRPAPAQPAAAARETILVVEDDRLSRDMVENTLVDLGFRVVAAKNSTEAIRAARSERVNLIVTDLYLKNPSDPEAALDGEDLLVRIKDAGVRVPAVITTGKDIIDDLVLDPKWFDLQVKGFIQKGNPFWVEELKLKVKEVLYKG